MSLFAELKRRNVFRVGIAYLAASWLLIQVADVLFPEFGIGIPVRAVAIVLAIGFIPALVVAWVFELTPEGIKPSHAVESDESITHVTGRKLDFIIIGVLALALVFVVIDRVVGCPLMAHCSHNLRVK